MREAEIESYFVWWVAKLGGTAYKFKSPSNRGVADRIACLPGGKVWFVELKRPQGGRLSELQKIFGQLMLDLGQNYTTLWTKEQIDKWAYETTKK
jgi:hypothetical protein